MNALLGSLSHQVSTLTDKPAPAAVAASPARPSTVWQEWLLRGTWILVAAGAFHAAYGSIHTHFLVLLYLFALLQLARARTWRGAFYAGLTVGLLIAVLRLGFFWRIFGGGAVALWLVFAFWPGLFVALARLALLPTTVPGRALTGRRQIWSRRGSSNTGGTPCSASRPG